MTLLSEKPLVFVMNACAGRLDTRDVVARATKLFPNHVCVFHSPQSAAELVTAVAKLSPENCSTLILFGGDGTLNRVLATLSEKEFPTFVFPAGTANDLATHLGCTPDWNALEKALLRGETRRLDIIKVNKQHFMTIGGVGIGALLTQSLNNARDKSAALKKLAKMAGSQIYTLLAAKIIFTGKGYIHRIRVTFSGALPGTSPEIIECKASNVFVCNQPTLGKDMIVAPESRNDDGLFEVVLIESIDPVGLLTSLASFKFGLEPPNAIRRRAATMVIEDLDNRPMSVFGDGENLVESMRLEFQILPKAFLVLVP